jgi:hypothetical protein
MSRIGIVIVAALAFATILPALPAQAQNNRSFVSGTGLDTNNCSFTAPCRSFAGAYAKTNASGEIDVLDPAGYGSLTINKAISIQAHGFGGITATIGTAITIAAGSSDAITLNGLLIDGTGTGDFGINITLAGSVQIIDCVIHHFAFGIYYQPTNNPANFLVSNTIASDNATTGIVIAPSGATTTPVTLSGITANNNEFGVAIVTGYVMIANSVLSNNSNAGLQSDSGTTWLAKSVISGNVTGLSMSGTVNSYGDNYINSNSADISGSLTGATPR